MIETPQERVSRWLKNPLVDLVDTEIREAIRAVLAEVVRLRKIAKAFSEMTWERDSIAAEVCPRVDESVLAAVKRVVYAELQARNRIEQAEAALGAYARLLVRAGVLRGNSGIGGQTMTGWACAVCRRDQVSPSTAHGVLCDGCRAEVIARAALRDTAPATIPTAREIAADIEAEAKRVPHGAAFDGGPLHGASIYNVMMWAVRRIEDLYVRPTPAEGFFARGEEGP